MSVAVVEKRKVRFACIEGIGRDDLPLANEIWLEDVYRAPWASREMMKLAAVLVRAMGDGRSSLTLADLEVACQTTAEDVRKLLSGMRSFSVIDSFVAEKLQLQVALTLSVLQRLKVIEARERVARLAPDAAGFWVRPAEVWSASKVA